MRERQIEIPHLVRIKPGALDRAGIYLRRENFERIVLLISEGLPEQLVNRLQQSLQRESIEVLAMHTISAASIEVANQVIEEQTEFGDCLVGLGGGKALDATKYIAHAVQKPVLVIPTSLSNDGFCSPQSSLTVSGQRRSLPSMMPSGLVVDTQVCLQAPKLLWLSGVGDLVSKMTAIRDWKLAFHHQNTPIDDFAALLSDASVFQFLGRPVFDLEGIKLLAAALMLNGVAMAVAGSSRPASGSEHLISHALDATSQRPRLHGLQVGMATYLVSRLYGEGEQTIRDVFTVTGFWEAVRADPFNRKEWQTAFELAPSIKSDFFTILSTKSAVDRLQTILHEDPVLDGCFIG